MIHTAIILARANSKLKEGSKVQELERRGVLTGGGVEPRRRAGTPPGRWGGCCGSGRDVAELSERGESAAAASA